MSDDLYHKALVDLARLSRPPAAISGVTHQTLRDNPLCGDRVALAARIEQGRAAALSFDTRGCVLCQAASTLASRKSPGWSAHDADAAALAVQQWLKGGALPWPELEAFAPVRARKSRHDCVTLPFEAVRDLFQSAK